MKTKSKVEDLNTGKWIIASEAKLRDLLIWPNKVYYSVDGKHFYILLQRSPTNAFSFCFNNVQAFGDVSRRVMVRLVEKDGTFVAERPLDDVIDVVENEVPLSSKFYGWGDFFWLTEDFKISRPEDQKRSSPPVGSSAIEYLTGRRK